MSQMLNVSFDLKLHISCRDFGAQTSVSSIQPESLNRKMLILHESVTAESLV